MKTLALLLPLLVLAAAPARAEDPAADAAMGGDFPFAGALVRPAVLSVRAPDGAESALTARELALLRLFAAHPGRVLGRDFLLNAAWGVGYYGTTRTLDQHVAVLRRKLGSAAAALETVRGSGYRLRAPG